MSGQDDDKKIPMWARTGHSRPITRRELLASGTIPFAAQLLAPSWMSLMFSSVSKAAEGSCDSGAAGMIPFITINLVGGAGLCANVVPLTRDGQKLKSYNLMGLGDGRFNTVTDFNGVMFPGTNDKLISKFLQGAREQGGAALDKSVLAAVAVSSRDDTADNKMSVDGMLTKAKVIGSMMPNLGTRSSRTGINQAAAVFEPAAPLIVKDFNSLKGSLGYAAALGSSLSSKQKGALAKLISNLSGSQTKALAKTASGAQVKTLVDCAGLKNIEMMKTGTKSVDPREDVNGAAISAVWGINASTPANSEKLVFAAMVYNTLKRNAGAASLELGGFDYHDGGRWTGDQKDLEVGQLVGRILATAKLMNEHVFIYVVSDGAVASAESDSPEAPWVWDRGTAGTNMVIYHDPKGKTVSRRSQIGWYTDGQVADPESPVGASPELASAAVMANYMDLNNQQSMFSLVAPKTIDPRNVDDILAFKKVS